MFPVRMLCLLLALACLGTVCLPAAATQVDCDTVYCFTAQDFSQGEDPLMGICITQLPQGTGALFLGTRLLQPGDILTAQQLSQVTFRPAVTQEAAEAAVCYLPIYQDRVEQAETLTLSIRGKTDHAPVAQDSSLETYRNIPNSGRLNVNDPEGQALTYTLTRAPRRGDVQIQEDGSFTYTPKKNKVGVDSFTYTAADPAGNLSREATVTVQIIKPTDARQYTDTLGLSCRFEAEWLRNTGLFVGESVNGQSCFQPDKPVSRGEFLAMLVKTLDIPTQQTALASLPEDTPQWLKPYLAAALRSGLTNRLTEDETTSFLDQPITGEEAAVMLQNILDLSVTGQTLETGLTVSPEDPQPTWAATCMTILADHGLELPANRTLTRADAAMILYRTSQLAVDAPGMSLLRLQQ